MRFSRVFVGRKVTKSTINRRQTKHFLPSLFNCDVHRPHFGPVFALQLDFGVERGRWRHLWTYELNGGKFDLCVFRRCDKIECPSKRRHYASTRDFAKQILGVVKSRKTFFTLDAILECNLKSDPLVSARFFIKSNLLVEKFCISRLSSSRSCTVI